jgi:hypothetical protein
VFGCNEYRKLRKAVLMQQNDMIPDSAFYTSIHINAVEPTD